MDHRCNGPDCENCRKPVAVPVPNDEDEHELDDIDLEHYTEGQGDA